MANVFGFSTEASSGGDFIPIIKYDARSGRLFRVDRVQDVDGFTSENVDITSTFKAIADFDNAETGYIAFAANSAPSFALVKIGQMRPPKPSEAHKDGIRFLMKLNKACGGDRQIREIAGVAKSFIGGVEQVYTEYLRERDKHPGQLPVIVLEKTFPVTTGSGATKSTNYRPDFQIVDWVNRPDDLNHIPVAAPAAPTNGSGAAPSTGGQTVPPPNSFQPTHLRHNAPAAAANLDDDFG